MKLSMTFLGTGTSTGLPMLGCQCHVCTSANPLNTRLRTSFLLQFEGNNIVYDTGPDIRAQMLRENILQLDAVIISHAHADHLNGIDDIRPYTFTRPIDLYTSQECAAVIKHRFSYIIKQDADHIGTRPQVNLNELDISMPVNIKGLECRFFKLPHGNGFSLGMTTHGVAIISDCHEIPEEVVSSLRDLNLNNLIIDCVREEPHRTHLNVEKCFSYIQAIGAKSNYLTHIGHELEHDYLQQLCDDQFPAGNVKVAYDGLKIDG